MKPQWMELLEAVCRIDSRTVDGAAGTTQVSAAFGERLESMGFAIQWHNPSSEEGTRGRHLVAVRNPAASRKLLLLGHTDTVLSPEDVPFRVDRASQRMHGAGVCDMKGGCVLVLAAIEQALAIEAVRGAQLVVMFNCTEEIAGPSFPLLARQEAQGAMACLSFEPARVGPDGEHQVVISRKGVCRFMLRCRGRSAHSGVDHVFGVSAIREIARKIEALETLTDYARDLTFNVGIIRGGNASNQVPDEANAVFDLRAFDAVVLNQARATVKRICNEPTVRSPHDGVTTELELSEFYSYPTWPQRDNAAALANRYAHHARRHAIAAVATSSGGGADASHVADLLPTLDGLGILGGGLHQNTEWADLNSLSSRTQSVADLIVDLCTSGIDQHREELLL